MERSVTTRLFAPLAFAFTVVILAFSLAAPQAAYAAPIAFTQNSFTFVNGEDSGVSFFTTDDSVDIKSAVSSNEKVASVRVTNYGILVVDPVGVGKAVITVTGEDSSTTKLDITVTDAYFINCLKDKSSVWNCWYGSKKLEVNSQPGAKCTLKVGKEKHSFKIGNKGYVNVKLKKLYKIGTKVTCTFKKGKYSFTSKDKISSVTWFESVNAKKKTVKVTCYTLTKGDVVKLKYKGKTYTKKIKKSKSYSTVKFKVKNKVKKNAKLKITIKNRYKQKLYSETVVLDNGFYAAPDESEDEGDLEAA